MDMRTLLNCSSLVSLFRQPAINGSQEALRVHLGAGHHCVKGHLILGLFSLLVTWPERENDGAFPSCLS